MSRIFINYRRADSEGHVGRIYDHLVQHFHADDIFADIESIKPGQDFLAVIEHAVAGCDVFLAIIGSQWHSMHDEQGRRRLDLWDDPVRLEIAAALKQDKIIIPVLVGKATMPHPETLPDDIRAFVRRQAVELTHQRFAFDVQKLIGAIRDAMPAQPSVKPRTDADTFIRKEAALKALRTRLIDATDSPLYANRVKNRYFPVLGSGNPDANLVFIGESPGKTEAETGVPFCGPSGAVLDEMLATIQLRRDDVFITNLLLDKPPEKREPTPAELMYYAPFVDQLIDIIQPGVLVALGRFAMAYLLRKLDLPEQRGKISDLHGKLIKAKMPYGDIHVVPLYHPAVVLYSATQKDVLMKDFQKLRLFI